MDDAGPAEPRGSAEPRGTAEPRGSAGAPNAAAAPGPAAAPDHAADGRQPPALVIHLERRQRRLLEILLVLAVVALASVVVDDLGRAFLGFGDIILTFFLAWLVAFIVGPLVERIGALMPRLPRVIAVALVYVVLLVVIGTVVALVAEALARSIADFVASIPSIQARLPEILAPFQQQVRAFGLQVDLVDESTRVIANVGQYATGLVGPLQSIAVASLGILGTALFVVILSVYISVDADAIRTFTFRLIPPQYHDEWRVFESSVSRSFGGFLRGQAAVGLAYAVVAGATSFAFGLQFLPVTTATSGVLQMIPFFGPFISWAPPVLAAVFTAPGAVLPVLACMGVGWFVVMNVLQPRLMQEAVGLHPIVVLGSVLVGSKVAGIAGAIFAIPIAAVLTSIFFYYFQLFGSDRTVTQRAARRLGARQGREVRVPREPQPGVDEEIRA